MRKYSSERLAKLLSWLCQFFSYEGMIRKEQETKSMRKQMLLHLNDSRMELFRLLHNKKFPEKKIIFEYFHKNANQDVSRFLLQMIKGMRRELKETKTLNIFFMEFYDMTFHYVALRKVRIEKRVLRVFEILALPTSEFSEKRWKEVFKRVRKIRL